MKRQDDVDPLLLGLCTINSHILKGKNVRRPGIEPGSTAWKATMLTFTPPTQLICDEISTCFIYSVFSTGRFAPSYT